MQVAIVKHLCYILIANLQLHFVAVESSVEIVGSIDNGDLQALADLADAEEVGNVSQHYDVDAALTPDSEHGLGGPSTSAGTSTR